MYLHQTQYYRDAIRMKKGSWDVFVFINVKLFLVSKVIKGNINYTTTKLGYHELYLLCVHIDNNRYNM